MGQFYEFDLHEAGCRTYVMLPVWGLIGAVTYLENHHLPYRVYMTDSAPDRLSDWYYFRNESGWNSFAICSGLDPEELLTLAEGVFYISFNEIGEEFCPVPERYASLMPADLFLDDRENCWIDYWDNGCSMRGWLDCLYDRTVLDDEGALALTRWIYKIAQIPVYHDELDPDWESPAKRREREQHARERRCEAPNECDDAIDETDLSEIDLEDVLCGDGSSGNTGNESQ